MVEELNRWTPSHFELDFFLRCCLACHHLHNWHRQDACHSYHRQAVRVLWPQSPTLKGTQRTHELQVHCKRKPRQGVVTGPDTVTSSHRTHLASAYHEGQNAFSCGHGLFLPWLSGHWKTSIPRRALSMIQYGSSLKAFFRKTWAKLKVLLVETMLMHWYRRNIFARNFFQCHSYQRQNIPVSSLGTTLTKRKCMNDSCLTAPSCKQKWDTALAALLGTSKSRSVRPDCKFISNNSSFSKRACPPNEVRSHCQMPWNLIFVCALLNLLYTHRGVPGVPSFWQLMVPIAVSRTRSLPLVVTLVKMCPVFFLTNMLAQSA